MSILKRFLLGLLLSVFSAVVFAQNSPISVVTEAEKEETFVDDQGVERSRVVPVATVVPGDEVIYKITFKNNGDQAAQGIKLVDPIPAQMRYVAGSAFGPGTQITFSADGGVSYHKAEELMIDDEGVTRVASPAEYTHIRWILENALEPSASAYARFKAVLK